MARDQPPTHREKVGPKLGGIEDLDREVGAAEVPAVELDDAAPRRLEVDLADDFDDDRARGACGSKEVELGRAELLRRVRDEEHCVRSGERGDRRGVVHGREPTDTGRVHQLQAAGKDYELIEFEGAPHSFFDKKASEFAEASDAAWDETLGFIAAHTEAAG